MIGTTNFDEMVAYYEKVFGKKPDMTDTDFHGWQVGSCFISVGRHSKMEGKAKDAGRVMFNLETTEVKEEFARIKEYGGTVIAEPYEMGPGFIATFADPDGNYFQLMSPWDEAEEPKSN